MAANSCPATTATATRSAFRRLYRELIALSRASPAQRGTTKATTAAAAAAAAPNEGAVDQARTFARKLLRQGRYIEDTEEARREYAAHVLDAMTKRVAFARSIVPLWKRPRARSVDGDGDGDGGRTTTYSVDGGRLVVVGRGGERSEERRKDCKPTRFASMAEARQEHNRLLRRQYFGRDPGPNWKGIF